MIVARAVRGVVEVIGRKQIILVCISWQRKVDEPICIQLVAAIGQREVMRRTIVLRMAPITIPLSGLIGQMLSGYLRRIRLAVSL